MGSGMYYVFDGHEGKHIGESTCWKDDADKKADKLNLEYESTTNAEV